MMMVPKESVDIIELNARIQPNKLAVRDLVRAQTFSYAQFNDLIARLSSYLYQRNYPRGSRIVVLAKNSAAQLILHFACSRLGLVFTPVNWRLSSQEISELLSLATPSLIVADSDCASLLAEHNDYELIDQLINNSADSEIIAVPRLDPQRTSVLLFTSGTTSKPKGVLLSEKNLFSSGASFAALTAVTNLSCFLCDAPMFHVIGLVANIRPVFQQGGSIAVSDGFDAERTLQWIGEPELQISHYIGVPQMLESFRKLPNFNPAKFAKLRALISGGAPHKIEDINAWLDDGVLLVSGFGMSESGTVLGMPPNLTTLRNKTGSVGISVPWIQLKLVNDAGNKCDINEPGELWVKGDSVMAGYFQNPEATHAAFSGCGWFKSGDILRQDEDGFYWVVDRKKDMFISGGENIYPAEIEAKLIEYPGLLEVAVVGIEDPQWGEVGCIAAVPAVPEQFDSEHIIHYLSDKLAKYKIPKQVVTFKSLPKTTTGKIQKTLLKHTIEKRRK